MRALMYEIGKQILDYLFCIGLGPITVVWAITLHHSLPTIPHWQAKPTDLG